MNSAKQLIKEFEGLRLTAYPDPASKGDPWTIGWGHTFNVRQGDHCTESQAEIWLDADMADAYAVVDGAVKVPLTTGQRDALCSFVFNIGPGYRNVKDGFRTLKSGRPSTMLARLNAGDYAGAAGQFDLWTRAAGNVMPGLVRRRKAERRLFESDSVAAAAPVDQPVQKEQPMSLAGSILVQALPGLINALPEIGNIFKKPDVAERNVEAVAKVGQILMQTTGATNMQEAVERVQADPQTASEANEALRMNRADIVDLMERINAMEQGNIKAAREYNSAEPLFVDAPWIKMRFIHLLSLVFVGFAGTFVSLNWASLTPELKGAVITLMIIAGWNGVKDYWMGSSEGSARKTDIINQR